MKTKTRNIFWETLFWIVLLAGIYMSFGVYAQSSKAIYVGLIAGIMALLFAAVKTAKIMSKNKGNETMSTLSNHIYTGAMAFLKREYKILSFSSKLLTGLL